MNKISLAISFAVIVIIAACSGSSDEKKTTSTATPQAIDPMQDKGFGPITTISLPSEIDEDLAVMGDTLFVQKCTACHKIEKRHIGPALAGVTTRRRPEWIMNMILNPEEMVMKNETAKKLLMEYIAPMANQSLTQDEARAVLEYFRSYDAQQNNLTEKE